jgi:cobalt/nickel transport system permease protein
VDLDRHIPRHSPIHRFDPRLKLLLAVAAILGITLLPNGAFVALGMAFLILVAGSVAARLGPWRLVRGSWIVLPFVLVALPLLFTRPGDALVAFDLGPFHLTITSEGLRDVLTIVLKSWLSVQVALLLTYTTSFADLLDALRALRLPAIMVGIIGSMYRFLAVIGDEATRMNRARASRSASRDGRGGGSLIWRGRVTGSLVGSLFIRSYERSERVYAAMLSRGYDGNTKGADLPRPDERALLGFAVTLVAILAFTTTAIAWGSS